VCFQLLVDLYLAFTAKNNQCIVTIKHQYELYCCSVASASASASVINDSLIKFGVDAQYLR